MAERTALSTLVERMSVGDLAHHAGMSVEELVAVVLEPNRPAAPVRTRARRAEPAAKRARPSKATATKPRRRRTTATKPRGGKTRTTKGTSQPTRARSSRTRTIRECSRKELHDAIDRWLIGEALEQAGGNITRVAERLGGARARIRKRWAAVRTLGDNVMEVRLAEVRSSTSPPSSDELRALGTFRAVYEAVDRWLLASVLEQDGGNVTKAAERLGTSRRVVRELRERLGIGE